MSEAEKARAEAEALVRARVHKKLDARELANKISEYLTVHKDHMKGDEEALLQRTLILLRRIGW